MNQLLRHFVASAAVALAFVAAPSTASAAGEPCYNDTDCPGAECGGEVCNWSKAHAAPVGDKAYQCNPAGTQSKGSDGWCTMTNGDDNCKCKAQGAKCTGIYCSFTKASDAPKGAGGMPGAGGTPAATAGTTSMPAPKPAVEESSGCSVSMPGRTSSSVAVALGLLGLGLAFARRSPKGERSA